jgi:glutaredoxin-like protein
MAILSERDRNIITQRFDKELVDDVKLVFFTQHESVLVVPGQECPACREQHELLNELAALSPKLHLEVHDFVAEADRTVVEQYQIEEIPALAITRDGNTGVKFYGLTSGYEFAAVLEDILDVSKGQTSLSAKTKEALAKVTEPVHIRVFVTPT